MAVRNPSGTDSTLPFPALQLLAPPVRLVSAALFKVLKQRDVQQYGTVEEFVTAACDTIPGLLTYRHQGKLALGLRARLILELCRGKDFPDPALITPHLERIRPPASPTRRDVKIETAVGNFKTLVESLLRDPKEKERFFQEEFPVDYGPQFDDQLEKLLWEFLIRLDQFLPVPNLAQTVSWLSAAPPVLEECARAATQPQLLKILLQHQTCLGHVDCAASLPPLLGDSILTSLSLMPSGRAASDPSSEPASCRLTPCVSSPSPQTAQQPARDASQPVTVIGPTSSDDPRVTSLATRRRRRVGHVSCSPDEVTQDESRRSVGKKFTGVRVKQKAEAASEEVGAVPRSATKRKQADKEQTDSEDHQDDDDDDDDEKNRIAARSWRKASRNRSGLLARQRRLRRQLESDGDGSDASCKERYEEEAQRGCTVQPGLPRLMLSQDPSLLPALTSCLRRQPRVLVDRLSTTSPGGALPVISPSAASYGSSQDRRELLMVSPRLRRSSSPWLSMRPCDEEEAREDKENCGVSSAAGRSPSLQMRNTEIVPTSGDGEDIIGDSEDEGTKNFKGRLFMKRYYKTKHNTYIPTLREFWKPGMVRLDLLSTRNGHR